MNNKPFFLKTMLLLLCGLLLAGPVSGAETAERDHWQVGRHFFQQRDFEAAYRELFLAFRESPGDPEINYWFGRAAYETGRFEEAVMAFERVLIHDPAAARAKVELARAGRRLGVRLLTEPDEPTQRHFLNGMISVAAGYDDNVRTAPVHDTIRVGAGTITIDGPAARPQSNHLFNTTVLISHQYRRDPGSPYLWRSTISNYNSFKDTASDRQVNLYGFSTGPVWQQGKLRLQGSLFAHRLELGSEHYLDIYGVGSTMSYRYSRQLLLNFDLNVQRREYQRSLEKARGRDATHIALLFNPVYTFGYNQLGFTGGYQRENASTSLRNSYRRYSTALRYERQLPRDFRAFVSLKREATKYDEVDPTFDRRRDDEQYLLSLGLAATWWRSPDQRRCFGSQLRYVHTDADSNIDLYRYRKNVTTLTLTYNF